MVKWVIGKMKSKIFIKFFLSFLLVLVIPASGIFISIYYTVAHVTKEELTSLNVKILDNVRNTIDSYMSMLNTTTYQLSASSSILKLVAHTDETPQETMDAIRRIYDALKAIQAQDGVFYSMSVYIPDRDIVISSRTSYYDSKLFYANFFNFKDMSSSQFWQYVKDTGYSRLLPAKDIHTNVDSVHNVITYVHPMPLNYNRAKAFFIALIDTNQVQKLLSNDEITQGHFKISDRQGQNLMLSSNFPEGLDRKEPNILGEEGYSEISSAGDRYIAVYNRGKLVNLNYVYYIHENTLLGKLPYIKMISAAIFIACLMLGIYLSYTQTNQHYAPVKGILKLINANVSKSSDGAKEEYSIISDTLYDTFIENIEFKREIQGQFTMLKANFLAQLLQESHLYDDNETRELLDFYKIVFDKPYFQVAIMNLTDLSMFYENTKVEGIRKNPYYIFELASSFFLEKGYPINIACSNGQHLAFISNISQPDRSSEFSDAIMELQEFLRAKFSVCIHGGLSEIHEGIKNLHRCYREAFTTLNYSLNEDSSMLSFYTDTVSEIDNIYYPLEKEVQIINNIKAGNNEGVRLLLDEIHEVNFQERKLSYEMLGCLLNSLVSTALKAYEQITPDDPEFINQSIKALYLMQNNFESEDVFQQVVNLCHKLCNHASEKLRGKNQKIITHVIEYIKVNYTDCNLSLIMIADNFNISYYYLSRMFKEETGENFADYLNWYRMEKAREILSSSTISIQNVAFSVGHTNSNTFIRSFKKLYSITPGQYREQNSPKK
jgi:two-component system, response regulator YesN